MKSFIVFCLIALPFHAFADLYDQRAAEAYRNSQINEERQQALYETNIQESSYRLANAFGAKHAGVSEINVYGNGKVRFNSGDGYACEAYVRLSYFDCYDPTGRGLVKFRRDEFVIATPNSYFDGVYAPASSRKVRRR